MLQKHGVDIAAVCQKWPTLTRLLRTPVRQRGCSILPLFLRRGRIPPNSLFSRVEDVIQSACDRLDFLPRRPELATEHSCWAWFGRSRGGGLASERGLHPEAIEAEIRRLYRLQVEDSPPVLDFEKDRRYARFTDRAQKGHATGQPGGPAVQPRYIGTEHILLGLIKEGSGVAANVLKNLDVDLRKDPAGGRKVSSKARRTRDGKPCRRRPARKGHRKCDGGVSKPEHNYVGTNISSWAPPPSRRASAAQVLRDLGLKLEKVREEVLNFLGNRPIDRRAEFSRSVSCLPLPPPSITFPPDNVLHRTSREAGSAVLRVLDAAANRAREGLRVVEDYVRFVLDDQHLTELCKQLRHDLTDACRGFPPTSAGPRNAGRRGHQAYSSGQRRDDRAGVLAEFRPLAGVAPQPGGVRQVA